jgi:16S rRNA (guanine527-N7)-methyltransferase
MTDSEHAPEQEDPCSPRVPTLEALEAEIEPVLREFAKTRSLRVPPGAARRMAQHAHRMLDANAVMNLTRITEPKDIAIKHVLDSLTVLDAVDFDGARVLDMGTGAGYPGIPLAVMVPSASFVLIDGTEKKAAFVAETIEALELSNAASIHGRAEVHLKDYDYQYIVTRAAGPISKLLPLLLPRRDRFDALIAMKGPGGEDEWRGAYASGATRGFELVATHGTELPGGVGGRSILVIAPTGTRHLKPLQSRGGGRGRDWGKSDPGR